jgi:hypothetical protein
MEMIKRRGARHARVQTHNGNLVPVNLHFWSPEMPQGAHGGEGGAVEEVALVGEKVEGEAELPDLASQLEPEQTAASRAVRRALSICGGA